MYSRKYTLITIFYTGTLLSNINFVKLASYRKPLTAYRVNSLWRNIKKIQIGNVLETASYSYYSIFHHYVSTSNQYGRQNQKDNIFPSSPNTCHVSHEWVIINI